MVNSIGNLGGYFGPFIVGWIKYSTGSFEAGLYFLAACALASGIIAYFAVQTSAAVTPDPTWRRPPSDHDRRAAANLVRLLAHPAGRGAKAVAKGNVRFWHKADIPVVPSNVRFWG
jgi:hypothetical protein